LTLFINNNYFFILRTSEANIYGESYPTLEIDENINSGVSAGSSNALSKSSYISNPPRSSGSSTILKRPRQLKLNGSTRGNELTDDEKISIDKK